jgi:hypothetical protein
MPERQLEPWGGEVTMPRCLRRLLRRPDPLPDTPEAAREARKAPSSTSVADNAQRAAAGPMVDLYREGRQNKRRR